MRYLSVCSGIEAATVAWHPLGWKAAAFSEIEAFPRAVLAHHYPDTPLHGDFTTIGADEYGPVELLVGGTPCQSFSIAGLRGGLADERGNLALEYLRLADRARPRWLVWENVPGVLSSSGGRDFGAFLGGLAQLGYGFAYRVLDAQFFGVPQRRRRVFVVGHLGDWRRAAAVLFERHSLSGHSAPRREKGQATAGTLKACSGKSGTPNGAEEADRLIVSADPSHCLNAGGMGRQDYERETLIAHSLRGEGFDASEDGTGRGTPLVPVAFDMRGREGGAQMEGPHDTANIRASSGGSSRSYIAFSAKDHGADAMHDLSPTLRAGGHSGSHANAGVMPAVAFAIGSHAGAADGDQTNRSHASGGPVGSNISEEMAYSLRGGRTQSVAHSSAVRRLTPTECARLQGFPDDYLDITYRGKPAADGPKYKALGNSMAVPVMRWIGERIALVDALAIARSEAA